MITKTVKMSSIPGLPPRGSDASICITKVHLHPLCIFVEFWGKFSQSKTEEYETLAKDIQSPGKLFQEMDGSPGDQCLVQVDGTWYRCRLVSKKGPQYNLFIIDKGRAFNTTSSNLAWGLMNYFQLPPEVEYCVLANVLPLSMENRWSPVAQEFLRSLSGKSVKAYVQDVLVKQRTFLLHIPCIAKQMYEMGFARNLRPDIFQDFLHMSLQSQRDAPFTPDTLAVPPRVDDGLQNHECFLHPELLAGTVEAVVVTHVTNPHQVFCQLRVFSVELKKLSEKITQFYEGKLTSCTVSPEMIGFPCAARGSDGKWFRSVLQQVFPANKVVGVLNVDSGTKHVVPVHNIRPLATEFFRMPVVTYICSLHGIIDKTVGWTSSQIDCLQTLLLYKTVIAKFEYQSISEGVHYVTLYEDENTNLNKCFGSQTNCLLECEKTLGDYANQSSANSQQHQIQQEANQPKLSPTAVAVEVKTDMERMEKLPTEDLPLHSTLVAVVPHVSDPSEFWIQTQNHASELDQLMDDIYYLYKDSGHKYLVKSPAVGRYCAAKSEDGDFYRALVTDVDDTQVKVFFVDYGNSEVVDRSSIRILPEKFKMLPCLALKCTLSGVSPKDGVWSQSACDFFINAVTNKTLKVWVTSKNKGGYVVNLTDSQTVGEKDLGTVMCISGLAVSLDAEKQPKANVSSRPLTNAPSQRPHTAVSDETRKNEMCVQSLNTAEPANLNGKIPVFKEHKFPIGSVLDVSVSHIESPNDFWCQLVVNSGDLKLLMHKMQSRYANSEFEPFAELTCVARHPEKSLWYRALVIDKHETPHVNVLFIDYGQTETVSKYDLRRIDPEFLTLHGQAFRCSLPNPVDYMCATNEWSDEAIERFLSFVDTATSDFLVLKCTIYAVMLSEQKMIFNIVDLETPFESASNFMASLVKSPPLQTAGGPSFQWDSYCYSTHDIKVGSEEQVTVTYVKSACQFFCHLDRNADAMRYLRAKVSDCCCQLENMKPPTVFGTLCFAKYSDGHWYRGQIKSTKPVILVNFVDYGETVEVNRSDLLPVPKEANDIMSVPVQAVTCCLSDIPHDVSEEVNHWFEANVTECQFRALVVAKEPDGKLVVELYRGKTQMNLKLRKRFQIEMRLETEVVCPAQTSPESSENCAQKRTLLRQDAEHTQTTQDSTQKQMQQTRNAAVAKQSAPKPPRTVTENGQKVKPPAMQLYRPPPQRQLAERHPNMMGNPREQKAPCIQPKQNLPPESGHLKSNPPEPECQKGKEPQKLPKFAELPSKSITPGMEADVYVSHCNSPVSFYVQLVGDEDEIFQLVDKLNASEASSGTGNIKELHPGDLVRAEFQEDESWYRAVVRDVDSNTTALVEFVDFGNTAKTLISKVGRLDGCFLQQPAYSTHCMLSGAATLEKEEALNPKVVSAFKEDLGSSGEKVFKCQFIRLAGFLWEVSLEDKGVSVSCKTPAKCTRNVFEKGGKDVKVEHAQSTEVSDGTENLQVSLPDSCLQCSHGLELMEGQNLEVCITAVDESLMFWCQLVDSEDLEKMTSRIADISQAEDLKAIDPECLLPGSWCLALFADDDLWHRAEVMEKEGEQLSVVFVDYGNTSKISVAHVRDMPVDLTNTPPLAFLCELDGFDCARGSWSSGACSEFSEITTDKVLQLTVTRVKKQDIRVSCSVQIQCEGLVINEVMKTWWTHSESENQLEETEQTLSCQTQKLATPMKERSQLEDQPDSPHSLEVQSEISGDDLQSAESGADTPGKVTETVLTEAPEASSSSAETAAGFKEEEAVGDENHTVAPEEVTAEITATDALADQDSSSVSGKQSFLA